MPSSYLTQVQNKEYEYTLEEYRTIISDLQDEYVKLSDQNDEGSAEKVLNEIMRLHQDYVHLNHKEMFNSMLTSLKNKPSNSYNYFKDIETHTYIYTLEEYNNILANLQNEYAEVSEKDEEAAEKILQDIMRLHDERVKLSHKELFDKFLQSKNLTPASTMYNKQ